MQKNIIVMDQGFATISPMQFGWEACSPSHSYGPAVREYWLLHYVVRGQGTFYREGASYSVGAGEIFVIEPDMETYYEADAKAPWEYIWIGFLAGADLPGCFFSPVISCPQAGEIFLKMKECVSHESGRTSYLLARLWDLIALLQEKTKVHESYIDQAIQCMRAEYHNGITVREIAARLNLDRSYFSNYFKKKVGVSPHRYLTDLRMERAAVLLKEEGVRPTIAAVSTGYLDLFTFSKAFKQYFGISPREFQNVRKPAQKNNEKNRKYR